MGEFSLAHIIVIAVVMAVFLVCREIFCWYWKMNRTVELLEKILIELRKKPIEKLSE